MHDSFCVVACEGLRHVYRCELDLFSLSQIGIGLVVALIDVGEGRYCRVSKTQAYESENMSNSHVVIHTHSHLVTYRLVYRCLFACEGLSQVYKCVYIYIHKCELDLFSLLSSSSARVMTHWRGERWGAGVETQKNVQEDFGGWGRVPFNETYAPSLSTIYDGA